MAWWHVATKPIRAEIDLNMFPKGLASFQGAAGTKSFVSEFALGSSPRLALPSRAIVHRPLTFLELQVPCL